MVKHTIMNTKELTSDRIYKICSIMLEREKNIHAEPLTLDDYMWVISYDILCILYGELNASKPHKIMGMKVYADKGKIRFIMLRENNVTVDSRGNFCFESNFSDNEMCYIKNDISAFKTALNSVYGISNIKPEIKKVIFNDPATVIFWNDGTKTVVKADGEPFDPEKGMAMAISKKMLGNEGCYYETFKKWLPKEKFDEYMNLPIFPEEDEYLTTKQVSKMTEQSIETIQKKCRNGFYPGAIKVDNEWRIPFLRTKGGDHNE